MSNLGNKEIMAKNIRYYLDKNNLTNSDICRALNFSMSTFSDWVHARTYPRIDKIELMANYFGIEKSDLVEIKPDNDYLSKFDLTTFKQLSDNNITKVNAYAKNLLSVQDMEDSLLNAAHLNKNATKEDIKHDDNIMKNDF